MLVFDFGITGIDPVSIGESNMHYLATFDIELASELEYLKTLINEGTALFDKMLGYKATYFVPTNGCFNLSLESELHKADVKYLILDKLQEEPIGNGKFETHIRWLGKKNKYRQIALSCNAGYEPAAGGKVYVSS